MVKYSTLLKDKYFGFWMPNILQKILNKYPHLFHEAVFLEKVRGFTLGERDPRLYRSPLGVLTVR